MRGFIIAVVGAPGCGKSFLVRKLALHYRAKAILEGEEGDFPARIQQDLRSRKRNLELFVWWRNKLASEMQRASQLRAKGKRAILDNYPATNETYAAPFFTGFLRTLAIDLCRIDNQILPQPDLVIFLRASPRETKRMVRKRARSYDNTKAFLKMARNVERNHEKLFAAHPPAQMISVVRDGLDFEKPRDLRIVTDRIDRSLHLSRKPL